MTPFDMRILYISKYARSPISAGISRQYLYAKKLAEFGNQVQLIYSRSNGSIIIPFFFGLYKKELNERLEIVILNGPLINFGFNLRRVFSWIIFEFNLLLYYNKLRRFRPDVIIVSSLSILTYLSGLIIKKTLKIPLVIEIRDLYPLTLIEVGGLSEKNPLIQVLSWIEKLAYRHADLIVSSLENAKIHVENVVNGPINFKWLPMCFNEEIYAQVEENQINDIVAYLRRLRKDGRFVVGYAGTIGKANALEDLFSITKCKSIKNSKIHFVFIGDGPMKDYYRNIYPSKSITYFDPVPKRYLHLVLKECSILVNTWLKKPLYDYGISPNKWIDYMYSGRPILLSLDAKSKIFNEAKCGWQIEAQNLELLRSTILNISCLPEEELNRLGMNGKRYLLESLNSNKLSIDFERELIDLIGN